MQDVVKRYAETARREHGVSIRIRVGLNSGDVVVRAIGSDLHMDYTAVGQTTHLAARMEQLADPGSIFLTPDTLALAEGFVQVASLGAVAVKGVPTPKDVYELTGVSAARSRLQAAAARGLSRFVGRAPELEQLHRALELARQGRGQLVAIVGEPGVGKSRLIFELTHSRRLAGWRVLEAGSVSYGKAATYWPVVDLLKSYFGVGDDHTPREIREKITGKVLTLDRALEVILPALLALVDASDDPQWQLLDPSQRQQHMLDAVKALLRARASSSLSWSSSRISTGSTRKPSRSSTGWSRHCRRRGCCSSSTTGPSTRTPGAARRSTRRSDWTRCLPATRSSCFPGCSATTPRSCRCVRS
jgi:hypothetical protein